MKLALGKALRKGAAQLLKKLDRSSDDHAAPVAVTDQADEGQSFDDIEKRLPTPIADSQNLPSDQLQAIIHLFAQGHLQQALVDATNTLKRFPDSAVLYNIAGACHAGLMQFDDAIASYTQALTIDSNYAKAHNNMAIALNAKGESKAAIASCKKALEIDPDYADAYNNMANFLKDRGDLEAAIDSYKQALKITPDDAKVHNNMGITLCAKGDLDTAIESYKQALIIQPDYAEAYLNIGVALQNMGDLGAAIDSYKQALIIQPDYAEAYLNIGLVLCVKGYPEASIDNFEQAIKSKPNYAEAYYSMGNAQVDKGDIDGGIESYEMALKIKPDYQAARADKLHQQSQICDWSALEQDRDLIARLGVSTEAIEPFAALALEDAPERHRVRSELYTKKNYGNKTPLPSIIAPLQKPKRLRIGYFSADFNEHPVAYLIAKVLEIHDHKNFEVYGYSIGSPIDDNMRHRLIKAFDVFNDVDFMSDRDVALLARQNKIDIAIDLMGYTKNSRPGIFFYRAAPVQISYLGYPGSMGADFIDYIIADLTLIPVKNQKYYSEKPIYLPHHYQAQDDTLLISDEIPSRHTLGLPEEGFIFCAINNSYKITMTEFDIWMRILSKVEGSVLWLLESNQWAKINLLKEAQARGIAEQRLIFAKRVNHKQYLAQFKIADLYLDSFYYNAGATASNALWAGLPVLTKPGEGYTARMAASLLSSIDLSELVTHSLKEYESLALELATNPQRLSEIRNTLAENRLSTPLFNTALYTKHLENGYEQAYQRYYDGKQPKAITVTEDC